MFCSSCGHKLAQSAAFCSVCGAPTNAGGQPPQQQPQTQSDTVSNRSQSNSNPVGIVIGVVAIGAILYAVSGGGGGSGMSPGQLKMKRGEVPSNMKAIKTSQLQYEANMNSFVKCAPYPFGTPGRDTKQWVKASSGGFETINWAPYGDVRGQYWVVTSESRNSNDFTIYGISDIDGDGVYATYTATKSTNPTAPITAPDVY